MKMKSFLHLPRGTHDSQGETAKCVGGKRVQMLLRGFLIGLAFLTSQSLTVRANSLSLIEPDFQDGIPKEIRIYCELVGTEFDICPEILEAMAYYESQYIPDVQNGNHYGLMQINVVIHKKRIEKYGWTKEDMFDPYKNLMVAADILHELYEMYGDDNPAVLAYYAGYSSTLKTYFKTGKMCPYAEKILTHSAELERLHGK